MIEIANFVGRLSIVAGLSAAVAACSSGGGGDPGPTFDFKTGLPSNVSLGDQSDLMPSASDASDNFGNIAEGDIFPLVQSVISYTPSWFGPDSSSNQSGATIEVVSLGDEGPEQIQFSVPGADIYDVDMMLNADGEFEAEYNDTGLWVVMIDTEDAGVDLDYTRIGQWQYGRLSSNDALLSYFFIGYQTPEDQMPAAGTATYTGYTEGVYSGDEYLTQDGAILANVWGKAILDVDFGSGDVLGRLSDMQMQNLLTGDVTDWNDVALSGSIAGSSFSGGAAVTNAPNESAMNGSAVGTFNGMFMGPSADEAAWGWSLRDATGGTAAGVAGAAR